MIQANEPRAESIGLLGLQLCEHHLQNAGIIALKRSTMTMLDQNVIPSIVVPLLGDISQDTVQQIKGIRLIRFGAQKLLENA